MPLSLARARAENLAAKLRTVAERVEVVGSIRRERAHVGDIELLVEPRWRAADLFGSEKPDIGRIRELVATWGEFAKAGNRYMQVRMPPSSAFDTTPQKIDVFLVHPPAEWGPLLAIRTGPAAFSKLCVTRLREKGWRCSRGAVYEPAPMGAPPTGAVMLPDEGGLWVRHPCPTEAEFFAACGIGDHPPQKRDELVQRLARASRGAS